MERQNDHLYKNFFSIIAVVICFLLMVPVFRLIPADAQQTLSTVDASREQALETKILTFFDELKRGSPSAIDNFLRNTNSPLVPPQISPGIFSPPTPSSPLTTDLRTKVDDCKKQFGDILNWEKIEDKKTGNDIIVYRYVLKYDQYPVIWTFAFYRKPSSSTASSSLTSPSGNVWTLIGLHFNIDIL